MPDYSKYSDEDLLVFLKKDDHAAFAEIFNRYDALLFNFAYKKVRDKDEAKDILQEVFVRLWNNRSVLELKISLHSYLYRAVLNKTLNLFRHQGIRENHVLALQQMIEETAQESDYSIREKDIERLIELEVAALPPKMKEVFELRKKQFLTNKQIAEQMGISEQTVETHMKRALRVLRTRLGTVIYLFYIL